MNKKVKNATPCVFNGIQFKSILEKNCYMELRRANLTVLYEPTKFVLFKGERVSKPYVHYKKGLEIIELDKKLVDMTWSFDYEVVNLKGHRFVVEAKGKENDTFPLKLKMFRQAMENEEYTAILVVNSKKDCLKAIEYIKNN